MLTWFVGLNVRILVSVIKFWELWGDVGAGDNLECDDVFFGGEMWRNMHKMRGRSEIVA